jgi:hypothetical protein
MFITGVNNTGKKFINPCHGFSEITGDNFISGDNDTGEQLSPVTTTPVINLLLVTRTRTPWGWGAAKDMKVEWDKSAIFPAAEVCHDHRWCNWNPHEKLHP